MLVEQTKGHDAITPADIEHQVNSIAGSTGFANAEGLRALLLFLARRTLLGENKGGSPKEQEIATDVLGRSDEFDSRTDSSVRVLVGRLRSKLAEYYVGPGAEDPILIEVPKGSYSLIAKQRTRVVPAPADPVATSPWRRQGLVLAICCVASALAGLAAGVWMHRSPQPSMTEDQRRFWQPFLDSPRPTLLVLGTPRFATVGPSWVVRSPAYLNDWPAVPVNPELQKFERLLNAPARPVYTYVASGEALAALTLTQQLEALRPKMHFRRSAQFQWDELRSQDVIFLGAPKLNPPTRDLPIVEELTCEAGVIRNLHPKPGEPAAYGIIREPDDGPVSEGHVLVTRVSTAGMMGEMVSIGSPVSEGTWAAADYISRPDYLRKLMSHVADANGKLPEAFQVVLRYRLKSEVPIEVSYVMHRELRALATAQ